MICDECGRFIDPDMEDYVKLDYRVYAHADHPRSHSSAGVFRQEWIDAAHQPWWRRLFGWIGKD